METPKHANVRGRSEYKYLAIARKRRRSRKVRRIVGCVCAVIAVLAIAGGSYALWFSSALDAALSRNTDTEVQQELYEPIGDQPFYTLVLGSDRRNDETVGRDGYMYTDVMLLMRTDPKNRQITLLSIPRDTPCTLDDGKVVKMNDVYNYEGIAGVVRRVGDLTGVNISHYVMVYVSDLRHVVDRIGGVEVDVAVEIVEDAWAPDGAGNIKPGRQVLNGRQAQLYATSRHEAEGAQEEYRQQKVRQLISAIVDKILDRPFVEIPGLVVDLAQYIETSMRTSDIASLGTAFAGGVTMYSATGPSDGDFYAEGGEWFCYENPEGWAQVMALVDAGENPAGLDYSATQIVPE